MWDLHHGFQNTRARDILEHVIAQCPINPFMILDNKARLKEAWDSSAPFADPVGRALEVQEFASDVRRPINDREIMTEAYTIIYQTGILTEYC